MSLLRPAPVAALFSLALLSAPLTAFAASSHSSALDLNPTGQELWVVNPDHASVGVIWTLGWSGNTLVGEVPVGREPWTVDVHPTNGEVWVACSRDDRIDIIDAAARAVVASIPLGFETFAVSFDPSGTTAIATATGADKVYVIDVASRTVTHEIPVYRRPRGIAWSTDGSRAWISHLVTPDYFGRLTEIDPVSGVATPIDLRQVFGTDRAGYPSAMQNLTLAPAPGDSILWIPCTLINSAKGELSGLPLTPYNTFHAVVRPVNIATGEDLNWSTYFLSEGGTPSSGYAGGTTPVGGPVAVDFRAGRAYVANMNSNDVTVLDDDLLAPHELFHYPAGAAPIGVITHPDPAIHRVYVANWLSRDVTVFNPTLGEVIATVPSTALPEPLSPEILEGKQLFFTSTGRMSVENRNSCTGCHTMGRSDARNWDLTQTGGAVRASKDWRGAAWSGPHGWTAGADEVQDNEWSIRGLLGGVGLIDGTPNPKLGAPNAGLSPELDHLAMFVCSVKHRPDTPFLAPDGSLTAEADSGRAIFFDPAVGCATCHIPPFYTDSSLDADPYILHDVGSADSSGIGGTLGGVDTPSLVGTWDQGPWMHHNHAKTMVDVLTTFNPDDLHGVTSQLSPEQIGFLAQFVLSIGWPDSLGAPVDAPGPTVAAGADALERAFPNPFREGTSLRFAIERGPARVRIDVVDVSGRRVRTLLDRTLTRGGHVVGWDTRDDAGRPVSPGVYFARLSLDGEPRGARKMTVVR